MPPISSEFLVFLAAIGGAGIAGFFSFITFVAGKHYEEKLARRQHAYQMALENWKTVAERGKEWARATGNTVHLQPLDMFIIHATTLVELSEKKNLSEKRLREELTRLNRFVEIAEEYAEAATKPVPKKSG